MVYLISGIPGCGMHVNSLPMASVITPPHHLKNIRTERLGFFGIVSILNLAWHTRGLPNGTVVGPWNPHVWSYWQHGLRCTLAQEWPWALSWHSTLGLWEYGLQWGKTTCYHGQPSCSLITLNQNFYSLSTSKGNKKHVRISPGSQVAPCPSQVCSYFIYTSRII